MLYNVIMIKINLKYDKYFTKPTLSNHKQYEALRALFVDKKNVKDVAKKFGYTVNTVYSLIRDFKNNFKENKNVFFIETTAGRKNKYSEEETDEIIIELRKKYLSVPDIKAVLDSKNIKTSSSYIYLTIMKQGFVRLPRRSKADKHNIKIQKITAPISEELSMNNEIFSTHDTLGLLCMLPYLVKLNIHKAIQDSNYPETTSINKVSSILSFLSLKLSGMRRYSVDDMWCMDRGLGLFAGLNVLPKTSWFSSYSSRITRKDNLLFLKSLHKIWVKNNLLSDTSNLDFTTIPYWGDDSHLENNWSGKRNKALSSMLAVLAQDPDSGIIDYGDTNIKHDNQNDTVLEFLDFYSDHNSSLRYVIFDSKFTPYENLKKIDLRGIKFITIRRRGKNIVDKINETPNNLWKKIRVECAGNKKRTIKILDEEIFLRGYGNKIRQISITGHGKIKPALVITNDFELSATEIVRKYCRRWIVEKGISEQIEFFHLNRVSSSMVIKVDFDFTMTILAHNLYRIFSQELDSYSNSTSQIIFEKFLHNNGDVEINDDTIIISLKKKRNLPLLLSLMNQYEGVKIPWLKNKKLFFRGASTS